ncbi:MAG: hypothetical protein RMK74_08270 [Myxococcales bacterium]|nr:hypothetical protein [Myxococcales bacterium]
MDAEGDVVVGVDENGLGPRLGPLVVTAVCLQRSPTASTARLRAAASEAGIGDSKLTAGFGRMATAETIALGLLERLGPIPRDADELLARVALDGPLALRARCPQQGASRRQCWERIVALPAFGGDPETGRRAVDRLERAGIVPIRIGVVWTCTAALNDARAEGRGRLDVDLEAMERLVLDARRAVGRDVTAVCGMVGGVRDYATRWRWLDAAAVRSSSLGRHRCVYDVAGVGRIAFEVDADARHLGVQLASMVGKYVRELSMARIHEFYGRFEPELPRASGYHDSVTARFIAQTASLRRRLRILDRCFERETHGGSQARRGRNDSPDASEVATRSRRSKPGLESEAESESESESGSETEFECESESETKSQTGPKAESESVPKSESEYETEP